VEGEAMAIPFQVWRELMIRKKIIWFDFFFLKKSLSKEF
jgi:hypothetical protein